jgi:hypothetical protein
MEDDDDFDYLLEGENKPTNPELWSRAKAAARSKFTKYPCVSMDSLALTKHGWKSYNDLIIGEEICTFNIITGFLEWKPIINLHYYLSAPTVCIQTPQTNFSFVCTPNHKWVLKKNWKEGKRSRKTYWKKDCLIETKDINQHMEIITSAKLTPLVNESNLDIVSFSKNEESWVEKVINMSTAQREAFFAAAIVYDGYEKKLQGKYKNRNSRFGFSQKNKDHGDALEICAVLLGYRVSYRTKSDNNSMRDWTLSNRNTQSTQNIELANEPNQPVWCPETENHTWVMKQKGMITITGNSAYANAWAAKWYKSKGGGWRKKKKKANESFELDEALKEIIMEDLRDWFKEKWKRISSSGEVKGECGSSKDTSNPDRCLPASKAYSLSKKERAATAKKKKSKSQSGRKQFVANTKKAKVKSESYLEEDTDDTLYE